MSYLKIEHPIHSVSFAYIDGNTSDLYTYYFNIENGEATIHSIDIFEKNSKNGKTYKHNEIYHHTRYNGCGKIYNYEKNEYEEIIIPIEISVRLNYYIKGFLVNEINLIR